MKSNSTHIVITGPESSGKTTLWNQLQNHIEGTFIAEQARTYLDEHGLDYKQQDIQNIASIQFQKQLEALNSGQKFIISDTCLLTLIIWQEEKYGFADSYTMEWFYLQKVDCYILLYPDIPWEEDPQRESEGDRLKLFERYKYWLNKLGVRYEILKGNRANDVQETLNVIDSLNI